MHKYCCLVARSKRQCKNDRSIEIDDYEIDFLSYIVIIVCVYDNSYKFLFQVRTQFLWKMSTVQ